MNNKSLLTVLMFALAAAPIIYLGMSYDLLPAQVPTHYNIRMEPDNYSSKSSLWVLNGMLSLVSFGVYLLLDNIHLVDPKRANAEVTNQFRKLGIMLVVIFCAINFIILVKTVHPEMTLADRLLLPSLGVLFAGLGNYMYNVKPNYFVGIRVPWTLHSEYNWRKTHRLAGILWFAGGLVIIFIGLFLPFELGNKIFNGIIAILILIPVGYSFYLFRQEKNNPRNDETEKRY